MPGLRQEGGDPAREGSERTVLRTVPKTEEDKEPVTRRTLAIGTNRIIISTHVPGLLAELKFVL